MEDYRYFVFIVYLDESEERLQEMREFIKKFPTDDASLSLENFLTYVAATTYDLNSILLCVVRNLIRVVAVVDLHTDSVFVYKKHLDEDFFQNYYLSMIEELCPFKHGVQKIYYRTE